MKLRVAVRLALAETRRSRGTLLFCVFSIALGVLSLTAVRSILVGLQSGIVGQARSILGADLLISANQPLDTPAAESLTASLVDGGAQSANITSFYSMLTRVGEGQGKSTRMVRVRAIDGGYPFYGSIDTEPAAKFANLGNEPSIIVDPTLLRELGLAPGSMVKLGERELKVTAAFIKKPGSPVAGFALAPSVYVHESFLADTELLQTGSRVSYARVFRTTDGFDAEAWKNASWETALAANIGIQTSRESAASVQRFLRRLSYFLTVVGLITLLLGALGIGSAMNVFIRSKLDNAAVLRCLGARPRDVFLVYLMVALVVGALGSAVGVVIGSLIPTLLAGAAGELGIDLLPAQIRLGFSGSAALHGVGAGLAATLVFALVPVYRIGRVSPLRVMRRNTDPLAPPRRLRDILLMVVGATLLFGFILALAVVETDSMQVAVYFTAAVGVSLVLLALVSRSAMFVARRLIPRLSRYHLKQGFANLYRPGNQTTAVITAIGVGVLLIATVFIIEASLQRMIAIEDRDDLPNLFIIDIQPDQRAEVDRLLTEASATNVIIAPMVAARIASVNGASVDRSQIERNAVRRSWQDRMRTREYFLSYRELPIESEEVVEGTFWSGRPAQQEASIDVTLATNLGIDIGDTLTLDIQGIPVDTVVTSFRRIRWQAMRPNAMILLSPGEIERAPAMFVSSLRVVGEQARYSVQERLVQRFPNLSIIDITETANTVRFLLGKISTIVSFLALMTVFTGAIILGGAIAAGRFARRRESMLLRVLGASRRDLQRILVSEYAALAILGGASGWLLAEAINRPALGFLFDSPAVVPYTPIAIMLVVVIVLNVGVGLAISRGVANGKPLDVLRED